MLQELDMPMDVHVFHRNRTRLGVFERFCVLSYQVSVCAAYDCPTHWESFVYPLPSSCDA